MHGLPDEIFGWHPAPDEWCINEVLGHLMEADHRGFDGRIRLILVEDRPELQAWSPNTVAIARADCQKHGRKLLDELASNRRRSAALIHGLTDTDLARWGRHPQAGKLYIADLIFEWVHHDARHIKQILSNLQEWVWPMMGNARRFSEIF